MPIARAWLTIATTSAALLSSCASVSGPETQTVIGRIARTLPAAATESKLGEQWGYAAYEVRPVDRPGTTLFLAVAYSPGTCPDAPVGPDGGNAAQLYRIEYTSSRGEIEILFPTYSDLVAVRCEKVGDEADTRPGLLDAR